MKAKETKVTFPMKSIQSYVRKIMVNGVECGWAVENCQHMWHFKFTINGKSGELWFKPYTPYSILLYDAKYSIAKFAETGVLVKGILNC